MEIQWVKTEDYTNRSDCMFVCKCKRVSKFRTFLAVVKTMLSPPLSLTHSLFNWYENFDFVRRFKCSSKKMMPRDFSTELCWMEFFHYLFIFKWHFSTTALILLPSSQPIREHSHLLCLILRSHFGVSETWIHFLGETKNAISCNASHSNWR